MFEIKNRCEVRAGGQYEGRWKMRFKKNEVYKNEKEEKRKTKFQSELNFSRNFGENQQQHSLAERLETFHFYCKTQHVRIGLTICNNRDISYFFHFYSCKFS